MASSPKVDLANSVTPLKKPLAIKRTVITTPNSILAVMIVMLVRSLRTFSLELTRVAMSFIFI